MLEFLISRANLQKFMLIVISPGKNLGPYFRLNISVSGLIWISVVTRYPTWCWWFPFATPSEFMTIPSQNITNLPVIRRSITSTATEIIYERALPNKLRISVSLAAQW